MESTLTQEKEEDVFYDPRWEIKNVHLLLFLHIKHTTYTLMHKQQCVNKYTFIIGEILERWYTDRHPKQLFVALLKGKVANMHHSSHQSTLEPASVSNNNNN